MTKEDLEKLERLLIQSYPINTVKTVFPKPRRRTIIREVKQSELIRRLAQNELERELLKHAEELIRSAVLAWKMDQLGMSIREEDQE